MISQPIRRRTFLVSAVGAAAGAAVARPSVRRWVRPEPLNIAMVGTANRAADNLNAVAGERIVALCDVDRNYLAAAGGRFPDARRFEDFREMLGAGLDIDAVVVSTPDHIHAPASAMALEAGKHVYCEKPLTHTVREARVLTELAAKRGVATQMGTQIHAGENYRRVVELIASGAIGPVREAHVWCGKSWSDGRYGPDRPTPAHLNWECWTGPAEMRPYCDGLHPASWRSYWAYGTGTLGDMACHYVDLVFWALGLGSPSRVEASGPEVHPVGAPRTLTVRWDYAEPNSTGAPGTTLWWYDGGPRPPLLDGLRNADGSPLSWGDGQLFVGESGMVISDYGRHLVIREGRVVDHEPPARSIEPSIGHHAEWIRACREGGPTTCHFGYSGPLTETVLLGTVAYRAGHALEWDGASLAARSHAAAVAPLVDKTYRNGWWSASAAPAPVSR